MRVGVGEPTYFVAVTVGTGAECGRFDLAAPTEVLDAHNGDKQLMMLVADVESVEDGKVVVRWPISPVGLHRIQGLPYALRDARGDLRQGYDPGDCAWGSFKDRERRATRWYAPRCLDKLPGEMIKGDAKVVDSIPQDRAQVGRYGGYAVEPKDVLGSLLVALSDDGLSTSLLDRLDSIVEVVQMDFRPINLNEDTR